MALMRLDFIGRIFGFWLVACQFKPLLP